MYLEDNMEKKFFCIRGHMKSGTNWVCRLLNLHPDVHSQGEYHWHRYFDVYENNNKIFKNLEFTEKSDGIIRKQLQEMVAQSMIERAESNAKFVGDRTPHTIAPVVLPEAPHISIIRDCRDVVVSKMYHHYNLPRISNFFDNNPKMAEQREEFESDPWYFHRNPERLLQPERFVRHACKSWAKFIRSDRSSAEQLSTPVMTVRYEDLHQDVESNLTRMIEFIGADPSGVPAIPAYLRPGHRKESPDKFNRKGVVGDWVNYVTEESKRWINEEAGEELIKQGYIDSLDWEVGTGPGSILKSA